MKNFKKILLFGITIFVFLFVFAYLFLSIKGKSIFISQIESLTHKKVTAGSLRVTPPLTLEIKALDIQGLLKADSVSVTPSVLALFSGGIGLNEVKLVKPEFILEKFAPQPKEVQHEAGQTPAPAPVVSLPAVSSPATAAAPGKFVLPRRLIIKHLNITEGKVNFIDHSAGPEGIQITVKDIYFNLTNLYLMPRSAIANFEFKGAIPWKTTQEEGKVEAEGWIDLFKKDMKAVLKVEGIDGIYLYPYYSQWVNLQKTRVERARLNFTSNINSLNNNVTAECHLELDNLAFKERSPEEEMDKAEKIAHTVLNIFKALNQGKIVFDFTIRTKMDKPIFGFNNIKDAVADKFASSRKPERPIIGDVVMLPATVLGGTIKGAADISKALISGTFAVGNEVKKSFETAFKKEPKEE